MLAIMRKHINTAFKKMDYNPLLTALVIKKDIINFIQYVFSYENILLFQEIHSTIRVLPESFIPSYIF